MRRTISLLALLCLLLTGFQLHGQVVSKGLAKKYQEDLQTMKEKLIERHSDIYHSISEEDFEQAVSDLNGKIPSLSEAEILVSMAQLVAKIGDGHTSFFPGNQKKRWFRFYPINLWSFSDGIYMIAAPPQYAHLFGQKIVAIDDTPIKEAFEKSSSIVGADNKMEFEYSVLFDLARAETMYVLGIANSPDRVTYKFEGGESITLESLELKEWRAVERVTANGLFKGERPPSLRLNYLFATELMLDMIKERRYYWYTYLENEKAIFFQYNACWDQKNQPTFKEVVDEMFAFIDNNEVERLIFDIRQNAGGEPKIAQPLLDELGKRIEFTQEGRFFVLTGRRTFSAALTNAAHLRSKVNARIVGEAPRGKPNNPSEGRDIDLKKTNLWLTVSTQFVERDAALGDAPFLPVDIKALLDFKSFSQGKDPILQAALDAKLFR